jgi:hypothetical protein
MTNLPKKPSKLLALALGDLEKCEQDDRYVIDMQTWHITHGDGCHVCLAGAVLAQSLGCKPDEDPDFNDDYYFEALQLYALNEFRNGNIHTGFMQLDMLDMFDKSSLPASVPVCTYRYSPWLFKNQMREIVELLEGAGF